MKSYLISFLGFITLVVFISSWRSIEDKNYYIEEETCADCHSNLTELKHNHEPATDACDNCHNLHSSENRSLLINDKLFPPL